MKKMTPGKANSLSLILFVIGMLVGIFGVIGDCMPVIVAGIVLMVCGVVVRVIFYRCPHCGKYLDRSTGNYCPYCGKSINS